MSFKVKKESNNNYPNIDWDFINEQLEEDSYDARIAAVIDLGEHPQQDSVFDNDFTILSSEDEAYDLIEKAESVVGSKKLEDKNWEHPEEIDHPMFKVNCKVVTTDNGTWVFVNKGEDDAVTYFDSEDEAEDFVDDAKDYDKYKAIKKYKGEMIEEIETPFKVNFKIKERDNQYEVGVLADLVDTEIVYVEGQEPKQYRVNLCSVFKGKMTGMALSEKLGSNSTLYKLAKATNNKKIIDAPVNVGDLAGCCYVQDIEKSEDGFVKVVRSSFSKIRPKDVDDVSSLEIEGFENGVVITFDEVTLEQLEAIKLNKLYIDYIQSALNYKGSRMERVLEEYLEKRNNKSVEESESEAEEEEDNSKKERKSKKAKKTSEKTKKSKTKQKAKVEEDDQEDDCPFDLDDE